ncbi:MAG: carboxypeptidase-like regulatory domain-containing protein [Terriglobales bacterium]|jgi:hypothetical protein
MIRQLTFQLIILAFVTLGWSSFSIGQTASQEPPGSGDTAPPATQSLPGSIHGTVVDESGATVVGALVRLTQAPSENPIFSNHSVKKDTLSDDNGQFSFAAVSPGPFQLTITSAGFDPKTVSGTLHSGEDETVPQIALTIAETRTEVEVGLTRDEIAEIAEEQIKVEEKQRVLGVIPNFYVSYVPKAAPLTPKQKFKLASRTIIDPFTFVVVAGGAGVELAQNHFAEYGQGAQGYAKRFGAGYADAVTGTFIGGAIVPSLLKQDPRYFYKGTGSDTSRFLYAIANSVICKGDNGRWQPNYSNVLGSLAAGGLSNLYYPRQDRDGAELTFENAAIGIGATAIGNLFQEFIIRKLTPKRDLNNP